MVWDEGANSIDMHWREELEPGFEVNVQLIIHIHAEMSAFLNTHDLVWGTMVQHRIEEKWSLFQSKHARIPA